MISKNLICAGDSYKFTHHKQYPMGTEVVYSYFEARKGAKYDETVFYGLQKILIDWLEGSAITQSNINQAKTLSNTHFGSEDVFDNEMWSYIANELGGKLPLRIKAVAEGTPIPIDNVLMVIENTDDKCFALTSFLETIITHIWYASTVATKSRNIKKFMLGLMEKSSDNIGALLFMLHDFAYRGVSSHESAGIGASAHLLSFLGTDTIAGMICAMEYYNADLDGLAYSVPASEHSVMCSELRNGESTVVKQILEAYPTGIVSIVADTYDIESFVTNIIGGEFKELIQNRDGKVVIRPDSPRFKGDTAADQVIWLVELLGGIFGYTVNSKEYKVLSPVCGVIYGDGLQEDDIVDIYTKLVDAGWSAENCVVGMGGGLLQRGIHRDVQRFAFKASAMKVNGEWRDVYKCPKDTTKTSKRGRLKLIIVDGAYKTVAEDEYPEYEDQLQLVFENGEIIRRYDYDEIRENASV